MKVLNRVQLIGRVGKDPEVRKCQNGSDMMTFTLATNESYKDKNGEYKSVTEWHNIKLFNANAFHIKNICKGRLLYIEGKIQSETYQNKQGQNVTVYNILPHDVKLLDKLESNMQQKSSLSNTAKKMFSPNNNFRDLPNDDIPF